MLKAVKAKQVMTRRADFQGERYILISSIFILSIINSKLAIPAQFTNGPQLFSFFSCRYENHPYLCSVLMN